MLHRAAAETLTSRCETEYSDNTNRAREELVASRARSMLGRISSESRKRRQSSQSANGVDFRGKWRPFRAIHRFKPCAIAPRSATMKHSVARAFGRYGPGISPLGALVSILKPVPIVPQPIKNLCPICGKASYSRDGIHPQCALQRADEPRNVKNRAAQKRTSRSRRRASDCGARSAPAAGFKCTCGCWNAAADTNSAAAEISVRAISTNVVGSVQEVDVVVARQHHDEAAAAN